MKITPHLDDRELACHDGTPYPPEWIESRARPLAETFEVIRLAAGDLPIDVLSAYRPEAYNRKIGSTQDSQHVQGRALDIRRRGWPASRLHTLIAGLYRGGKLPHLGGLGVYRTFVHFDVRPRPANNRLARWSGARATAEATT